ncbi:MAG TPA: PASTA domain-containing protein [Streptosporangiaceae bacterium]|nr:PASTA domain-containing protein [Streptosporangiaceae bacterium]
MAATITTADVNGRALVGHPVAMAVRRLRHLGLKVRVVWLPTASQPAGIVVAVRPGGSRPVGSRITVIGAQRPHSGHAGGAPAGPPTTDGQPPGHGHGKGHGHGSGKGPGKGPAKGPGSKPQLGLG